MSNSSINVLMLWRLGFCLIVGVLLAIILYCIRRTYIDIKCCPDDVVIIPSTKASSGSKVQNQFKVKEDDVKPINSDRKKIQYV